MNIKRYHLLYPEDRWVSADDIERWYWDAVSDNEMGEEYINVHCLDIETMIAGLSDMGFITLERTDQ
jgi:hypothetical protein